MIQMIIYGFCSLSLSTKKPVSRLTGHRLHWLGWLGSDQRVSDSESDALPLGYTPRCEAYCTQPDTEFKYFFRL